MSEVSSRVKMCGVFVLLLLLFRNSCDGGSHIPLLLLLPVKVTFHFVILLSVSVCDVVCLLGLDMQGPAAAVVVAGDGQFFSVFFIAWFLLLLLLIMPARVCLSVH